VNAIYLIGAFLAAVLLLAVPPAVQAQEPLSLHEVEVALARNPNGAEAEALAGRLRGAFGERLPAGTAARLEGTRVLWAVECPAGEPRVSLLGNIRPWTLRRVGATHVYAAVAELRNFSVVQYQYEVDGRRIGGGSLQVEHFERPPDTYERPGVPKGTVTQHTFRSQVFPGTVRDYWVYVPAQYTPEKPAAVMVFQDGEWYMRDPVFAPTVFDNLIHKGDMPVTVGIFILPGTIPQEGRPPRSNRSFEYDTLSDQYARFLRDEILPEVGKQVRLSDDPARRAICGISSGGICAFTVAWEMPHLFSKVLSHVGSFVNIASGPTVREGGHNYPALIRKVDPKPIRVFLQAGANDLDNANGNWPLANLEMDAALRFRSYDYRFDYGQGFHSLRHGAAIFPDSLRWLWRDVR
jgi:enterochelin esterase-like enzyme